MTLAQLTTALQTALAPTQTAITNLQTAVTNLQADVTEIRGELREVSRQSAIASNRNALAPNDPIARLPLPAGVAGPINHFPQSLYALQHISNAHVSGILAQYGLAVAVSPADGNATQVLRLNRNTLSRHLRVGIPPHDVVP